VSAHHFRLDRSRRALSIVDRPQSLSITLDFDRVYTFDRSGRLVSFFNAGTFYRRGLDHRLLRKERGPNRTWNVEALSAEAACSIYGEILDPLAEALSELKEVAPLHERARGVVDETTLVRRLLADVPIMGPEALARDGKRFSQVYSPVAILPPDHYLSLVVQVTVGCSHNKCRFCSFYHDIPFRVRSVNELELHMDAVIDFFGAGISLRQSLFLGDANALVVEPGRLQGYLERIRARFAGADAPRGFRPRGTYSFVDSFHTGFDRPELWREFRRCGLTGVYLGVESGSDELLAAMNKPTSREATRKAVMVLKSAGLRVGVILMTGLGGEAWAERHRIQTATLLAQLPLDRRDLVYFSPYREDEPKPSMDPFKPELSDAGRARQIDTWRRAASCGPKANRARTAVYSLSEFIY